MCDCIDRSPTFDATHAHPDGAGYNDKYCDVNTSVADTELTNGAALSHDNRSSVRFVPPVKHKDLICRNERFVCSSNNSSAYARVARPVVVQTLARTQSSADKGSTTTCSNLRSSDVQCIHHSCDAGDADELLNSSLEEQNVATKIVNAKATLSQSEAEESVNIAGADNCVVKNASVETSLAVSASDVQPTVQQQQCYAATLPRNLPVTSHSSDAVEHSSQSTYSSNEALKQPSDVSFNKDSVSKQRLVCKDNQLKRVAEKSKLASVKANAGSLSVLRDHNHGSRLSLKDAMGGARPCTYSLMEVAFRID